MKLQPLPEGAATWSDADARKNFELIGARVLPGNPDESRLLMHPLAEAAGGDGHHDGGKHWTSKNDPEWQTLAAWANGATLQTAVSSAPLKARIIQTNSAGDDVHIIDPATNKVVGEIRGIEVGHGAAASPDGRWIYVSNEANSTLDVVDARTLRVTSNVPLTGHPNNISISRDGRRVYVAIRQAPGAVDVIDTPTLTRVKSIPIEGDVHNTYVTPDGRYVIAGSIAGKTATAIDQRTEEPVWVMHFDLGVRPMAFEQNADGSTKRMFVAADRAQRLRGHRFRDAHRSGTDRAAETGARQGARLRRRQRLARHDRVGRQHAARRRQPAEQRRVRVFAAGPQAPRLDRRRHRARLGDADAGRQTAYVANAGSNSVSVVDVVGMREITRIPVGQVPKRNITAMLP